jgi:hypothetical protein
MKTRAVTIGDKRICTKCESPKALTEFREFIHPKNKKTYREGQCDECRSKYHKSYQWGGARPLMAEKKRIVEELKVSTPCADCKKKFPPVCMDFDHVRGVKRSGIAKMVVQTFSVEALREEIAKCDLVCANCHRIRTYADKGVHHRERVRAGRVRRAAQMAEV